MSIQERLQVAELTLGHSIVLPTPPACNSLIQRAREDGLPVGQVFIVSRRLRPGLRGGYERKTGDIWCHYWAGEAEGDRLLLQALLVLLAHIKLKQPIPTAIDEDWGQEQEAWQMALSLARVWGMPELLQEQELEERLAEIERLHVWHQAAGELAGSLDPFLARAAYHALDDIRVRQGWNDQEFDAALCGYSEQDEANAAVLAFDRSALRSTWRQPSRASREGPPFGDATLQQNRRTVNLLRSALKAAAYRRANLVPLRSITRDWLGTPLHLHFLRIDGDLEFPSLIACCNRWLVEESSELVAGVMWWVYSSGATRMRIYRMSIHYKAAGLGAPTVAPSHELWVLFDGSERGRLVEAAYQRFILCWRFARETRIEPLEEGLTCLWGWLNQEENEPSGS